MFARLLMDGNRDDRILISLLVGCHYIPILKPILGDNISIWARIEREKPNGAIELLGVLQQYAFEATAIIYSKAYHPSAMAPIMNNYLKA